MSNARSGRANAEGELLRCTSSYCIPWSRAWAQHLFEPLRLNVVEWMVGDVTVHQVRHEATQRERPVGQSALDCGQHRRILRRACAVAIQAGVDLDGDFRGTARALGRVAEFDQLAQRRYGDLHVGVESGCEVGPRRVQPRQHGSCDAVAAERDRLVDGGNAEFRRAGGQGRAAGLRRSMAVPVGLDDSHHLRRTRMLAQHGHIVRHGVEVDNRLGGGRPMSSLRSYAWSCHHGRLSQTGNCALAHSRRPISARTAAARRSGPVA